MRKFCGSSAEAKVTSREGSGTSLGNARERERERDRSGTALGNVRERRSGSAREHTHHTHASKSTFGESPQKLRGSSAEASSRRSKSSFS